MKNINNLSKNPTNSVGNTSIIENNSKKLSIRKENLGIEKPRIQPRFQLVWNEILAKDWVLKEPFANFHEIPRLEKIILSLTSKRIVEDKKNIIPGLVALELISGQKIQPTRAKKSMANFKIREGQLIGCKTTLRGRLMYLFLEKFVSLYLPRVREYRGNKGLPLLSPLSLDFNGNLNVGITECLLFPELENHYELFEKFNGFNITFVINTEKKKKAIPFYTGFQMPFSS